uniref:Uncharacterized protein n=1 Tax=Oryza punctata TaxID=4537 RepID=A0A0E0LA57_ORYPU
MGGTRGGLARYRQLTLVIACPISDYAALSLFAVVNIGIALLKRDNDARSATFHVGAQDIVTCHQAGAWRDEEQASNDVDERREGRQSAPTHGGGAAGPAADLTEEGGAVALRWAHLSRRVRRPAASVAAIAKTASHRLNSPSASVEVKKALAVVAELAIATPHALTHLLSRIDRARRSWAAACRSWAAASSSRCLAAGSPAAVTSLGLAPSRFGLRDNGATAEAILNWKSNSMVKKPIPGRGPWKYQRARLGTRTLGIGPFPDLRLAEAAVPDGFEVPDPSDLFVATGFPAGIISLPSALGGARAAGREIEKGHAARTPGAGSRCRRHGRSYRRWALLAVQGGKGPFRRAYRVGA